MFACLGRLGCLVIVALLAVAGYLTRDIWYPRLRSAVVSTPPAASVVWKPITPEAATKGTRLVERLTEKNGPVFADLSPNEFAAWLMAPAVKILGTTAGNPEATIHGDTLLVRANVAVSELGDSKALGPLASMLDGRQPVLIGGTLDAARPGLLAYHVTRMTVKELNLPQRLIDNVVQRISVKARTESMAPGAIPLPVPASVADVRISKGRVVLYKAVP